MSVLTDFTDDSNERPEDCTCLETMEDLPCFACFNAGFREPNPNPPEVDDDE